MRSIAAAVVIALAAMTAACGKTQQPKVELAKPLDTAKGLSDDINKKAEDRGAAADAIAK